RPVLGSHGNVRATAAFYRPRELGFFELPCRMPDWKATVAETPLISVVDDDPAVRDALWRLMDSAGFNAKVFASAEDFLNSSCLAETACLILDVQMPGMTGLQLQRRLGDSHLSVPIIFISGHA